MYFFVCFVCRWYKNFWNPGCTGVLLVCQLGAFRPLLQAGLKRPSLTFCLEGFDWAPIHRLEGQSDLLYRSVLNAFTGGQDMICMDC